MFQPPVIINKNYTPDQKGQEIRQEDVVRPLNHKITTSRDPAWQVVSRSRAPTYGSCRSCFRSGPLGKCCNRCNNANTQYEAILHLVKGANETLDSITLSEVMGQGHEVCLADHMMDWNRTPCRHFNSESAKLVIDKRYEDIKNEQIRIILSTAHWHLFLDWKDTWFEDMVWWDWWEGSDDNRSVLGGTRRYIIHENPNVPWKRTLKENR